MTRDVAENMMLMADCEGCDLYAGECVGADLYVAEMDCMSDDDCDTWFRTMAEVEAAVKRVDERYEAVCSIGEYLDTYFGVEFRHTGDTW